VKPGWQILLAALLLAWLPLPAAAESDEERARRELQQLQGDIKRINREIASAGIRRDKLQQQLRDAEKKLGRIKREIADNLVGLVFILASSAMWAAYIVFGARVARLDRGVAGLGVGLAIGTLALIPIGLPGSGDVWVSPRLLGLCLLVGVFSTAVGYGIDQFTLRRIPIRRFSVLLALLPVTAALIGWIALDQVPSGLDLLGIGLVLVGVLTQEREELAPPVAHGSPA
jgi:drug/metabolite transporter (DMT)-like permease